MDNPQQPFRIAIIGGGIGGLFSALCIHHFCAPLCRPLRVDVYEKARAYREIGAGIGLGINAARLAHTIGIGDKLNAIAGRRKNVWITFRRYDTGEDIITVPLDDEQKIRQAPVHRAEYLQLLHDECVERGAARLHVDHTCKQIIENPDSTITIEFQNDASTAVDFVVAADGIHSVSREHYYNEKEVYCGQIAYRGVVDIKDVEPFWKLPTYSVNWVAHDRHMLVYPISANTKMNVIAFVHTPVEKLGQLKDAGSMRVPRQEVLDDMAGFEDQAMSVIKLLGEDVLKWKLTDRDPFERWVFAQGRIALIGDASHAVLPHQGAGGGQSMEDGYTLALTLRDYLTEAASLATKQPLDPTRNARLLEHHFNFYAWFRMPRATKVQETTRQAARIYELQLPEFAGRSFEECLPIFARLMKGRMDWIWYEDLEGSYGVARGVYPGAGV